MTVPRTTTSTVDGYTTFSICSRWRLSANPGSCVWAGAASQAQAVAVVDKLRPDPILTNVRVGGGAGSTPGQELTQVHRKLRVVVLTAHGG
jgi:DNA-binding NarL/FixJ family response regulator